ncbi:MAG: hypothetical protein R2807_01675 [Chitinophagales bacterium]
MFGRKKFPTKNLGVALGPKAAIDWLFEQNEIGVILEDDILPSLDFFLFAKEMLHMYYDNENVMHINAMNFHLGKKVVKESYYFSCITSPWGWATWKRAWKKFDFKMLDFYENIDFIDLPAYYKTELKHYKQILDNYKSETELYAWDFQWLYCVAKFKGVSIVPSRNLALNTGFNSINATNTFTAPKWVKEIKIEELNIEKHPAVIKINKWADEFSFSVIVDGYLPQKIEHRIKFYLNKII